MADVKPTAFKRGFPAEQSNGLYGVEDRLIAMPEGETIIVIATLSVDEVMEKRHAGEEWPVVAFKHLEPLWDQKSIDAAVKLRDAAYKKRTGENALDFGDDD